MKLRPGAPRYCFCPMCGHHLKDKAEADGAVRQACTRCGWVFYPHVAISVSAVAVNKDKILLVRRRHDPFPGSWMCPSGFLEYGEMPELGVLRELREETGLSAQTPELIGMFRSDDDPREPHHLALFFRVFDIQGTLKNEDAENIEVSWFVLSALPEILLRNHWEVVRKMVEHANLP